MTSSTYPMRRSFCIPSMRRQISGPKHRSCTARTGNPRNSSALGGIMHVQLIGQACAPLLAAIMPAHGGLARAPSPCLRPCSFRRRCNDVWPCSLRRWWFGLAPSPYAPAAHAHGALPHDVWPCSLRRCWFGPSACALAGPHSALPPPSCNDVWPCSLRRCWCGPSAGPICTNSRPCSLRRCWCGPSACAPAGPHSALPPRCNDVWPCSLRRWWFGPSAVPTTATLFLFSAAFHFLERF